MNKGILIILTLIAAGCASKNPIIDSSLMGSSEIQTMNYDQIHSKLQHFDAKSKHGLGGHVAVLARATPITTPLIIADEKEQGKKQLRSDADTQKIINERLRTEVKAKPCFFVSLQTSGPIEGAQFKNWISKVKTKSGEMIDVEFANLSGVDSVPKARIGAWDAKVYQWENYTGACAKKNFDRTEDFSLILSSTLLTEVGNLEIKWTFSK